jgi:hypothetical protein
MGRQVVIFSQVLQRDNRLRPQHVALYIAILVVGAADSRSNVVKVTRADLMSRARISSKATYHRCIRDLEKFGYINYHPTFNSLVGTSIILLLPS